MHMNDDETSSGHVNPWRMVCSVCVLTIMLLGGIDAAGQTRFRIGPVKWAMDSIHYFYAPMTRADILFGIYGEPADRNVWIIDTKSGGTFGKVPGHKRMNLEVASSPDGILCMTSVTSPDMYNPDSDVRSVTRLFRVADMQLLHHWYEIALIKALSARLERALVLANKPPYNGHPPSFYLRDLRTGEDIQSIPDIGLNGWSATVFIDEWHQRVYLNIYDDGTYTITEFDAITGSVLRQWKNAIPGSMCRLRNSDKLLVATDLGSHPRFVNPTSVHALDLVSSTWNVVVRCPDTVVDMCDCMSKGQVPTAFWSMNTEGTEAYLPAMMSSDNNRVVLRRFVDRNGIVSDCMMNEAKPWPWPYPTQVFCDVANRNLYYVKYGSDEGWQPLYCRSLEATTGVGHAEGRRLSNLIVSGDELRLEVPSGGNGTGRVAILDLGGRIVKRWALKEDVEILNLPIADIPAGSYFCRIDIGNVHTTRHVMIVRQ